MNGIILIILAVLVLSCCLWLGMLAMRIRGSAIAVLNVSIATVLAGLIPIVGIPLSMIVMALMTAKLTNTQLWPKAVMSTGIAFALMRMLVVLGDHLIKPPN